MSKAPQIPEVIAEKFKAFVAKAREVHGDKYEYLEYLLGSKAKKLPTKILARCKEHGEFTQHTTHHLSGSGCKPCGFDKRTKGLTFSFEQWVAKSVEKHGDRYEYLALERSDKGYPTLVAVCKEHGEFKTVAAQHSASGFGCPTCGYERTKQALTFSVEEVMAQLVAKDPTKTYTSITRSEGRWFFEGFCEEHGAITKSVKEYISGEYYCRDCGREAIATFHRRTEEEFLELAKEVHGDTYTYGKFTESSGGTNSVVEVICKKHGSFAQSAVGHLQGYGCPSCSSRISKANLLIADYIEGLGIDTFLEERFDDSEGKMYADVCIPGANLVIEHLGLHWHSTKFVNDTYDLARRKARFEALGYEMLAVYEDELRFKKSLVLNMIKSRLGLADKSVGARRLLFKEVPKYNANRFLDVYHIQGSVASGKFYGLYEDESLVAVVVFNHNTSSRTEKASEELVELTRFATCKQVKGGLSKVLSNFLKLHPLVTTVVSYSDTRMFSGKSYKAVGFMQEHTTRPDFYYVVGKHRRHKSVFQKSRLAKLNKDLDMTKTEKELTEELGMYRVFDSGKTKWVYTR